jgi:hypothetical protein
MASVESSLPFISGMNPDKVVGVLEVQRCIDSSFAGAIQEIGDERKRITIFPSDFVESTIVDAESETTTLFLDEQDRSSARSFRRTDPAPRKVSFDIDSKGFLFIDREGVDRTERRCSSWFKVDLVVARTVRRKRRSFLRIEDVFEFVELRRKTIEIRNRRSIWGK